MGWLFNRRKRPPSELWSLSQPLLHWSPRDPWTFGDACMGALVLGGTGSGKTSGSGREINCSFLRNGFGGLVLTCKRTDREDWENYCRQTGRLDDLIIFDGTGRYQFNFLDEELKRPGHGAGHTENIVGLLFAILEIAQRDQGGRGGEDEGYWRRALRQLCRNVVALLVAARGRVTVRDLYRLVTSAPTNRAMVADDDWKRTSFLYQCLRDAEGSGSQRCPDLELIFDYLLVEFAQLSDRTRSVIVSTFTSMVDVLNRSPLRQLFSEGTNVRPQDTLDGKIILIDLPVKEFAEIGQIAAVIWKYCWQRAVEQRDVKENPRGVFLSVDEFQSYAVKSDQLFQTTARSARAAVVYMTQNVPNLLAAFGGESSKALTDSILGNLQTKIWHANSDPETNQWAASVIGKSRQLFLNGSQSHEGYDLLQVAAGTGSRGTSGFSEQMEFECDPRIFTGLRIGGPANRWLVDGIVYQGGKQFAANGKSWMPVTFRQQF